MSLRSKTGPVQHHLWESKTKVLHACILSKPILSTDPTTRLAYTKCGIDVPADTSFMSFEKVTCQKCKEIK